MDAVAFIGLSISCFLVPILVWLYTREEYEQHQKKTNLMLIERMPIRIDQKARVLLKLMTEQIYCKHSPHLWETQYDAKDANDYQDMRIARQQIFVKVAEDTKTKLDKETVKEAKAKNLNMTTVQRV